MTPPPATDSRATPKKTTQRRHARLALLALALAAGGLVLVVFTPRFVTWRSMLLPQRMPFPEVHRAYDTRFQLQDPWAPADTASNAVIAWRLLFPLIWHYLHLPYWSYLVVPFIGCVLVLWLTASILQQRLQDRAQTFMATALFAALPWYFVSTGWLSYFDSWLVLGLLIVSFAPSLPWVGAVCLLTPWIDERFVFALPIAVAVRALAFRRIEERAWRALAIDLAVIALTSLPYPAIRAVVWSTGDPDSTSYVQKYWHDLQEVPTSRLLEGLWSGYRFSWLMVAAAVYFAVRRVGTMWGAAFAVLVIGSSIGALMIAADMSRTLTIECTVMLLGVLYWHESEPARFRYALPVILAANLLFPAEHVLWPFKVPIRYLYTQIDNYRDPPPDLQPGTYFRSAQAMLRQGNRQGAVWGYTMALALDDQFAEAYVGRASLMLGEGNIEAAQVDLDKALFLNAQLPDALLMRAELYRRRGEIPAAVNDLRKALAVAPAEWALRAQAAEFFQQLTGQVAPGTIPAQQAPPAPGNPPQQNQPGAVPR